jgi:surface protein
LKKIFNNLLMNRLRHCNEFEYKLDFFIYTKTTLNLMNKILLFFTLFFISSSLQITAQYSITRGGTIAEIATPATGVTVVTSLGDDNSAEESIVDEDNNTSVIQEKATILTNNFITRWNLATAGSGATQISFGVTTTGTVNYTWQQVGGAGATGSGSFSGSTATITGLPSGATIDLSIQPANFRAFNTILSTDKSRLTDVKQWGSVAWTSMQMAFIGCNNLNITATDIPNLAGVTNMGSMFSGCSILNGPANINMWNTAAVTNMGGLFDSAGNFNQNIGSWNTAAVTNMGGLFDSAGNFNQNIGSWNTVAVTNMAFMFSNASAFNQNIGSWNTTAVRDMSYMFNGASAFNQNIGSWNTVSVIRMNSMFRSASTFNQNIGSWNTVAVTDMNRMFFDAGAFNQNIGSWNTTAVRDMSYMFLVAYAFNQNIGSWNTSSVTNMSDMFGGAGSFNQNIGSWNIANATNMSNIFNTSGLNVANYDAILTAWNNAGYTNKNLGNALALKYCATLVRTTLTAPISSGGKGWTITGDALNSNCPCVSNTSLTTGNWGTSSTWSCGHVPLATEPVQIAPGHTVTLNVNGTAKSLDLRGILNKQTTKVLTIQGN